MDNFSPNILTMINKGRAYIMGGGYVPIFEAQLPSGEFAVYVLPMIGDDEKEKYEIIYKDEEKRVKFFKKMVSKKKGSLFIFDSKEKANDLLRVLCGDYKYVT